MTLEHKALMKYLEDQRALESEGNPANPVKSLIERGRATEYLMNRVVKRRSRKIFDENNDEKENLVLLQMLERVFSSEDEISEFLDLSNELYCQHLS